MKVFRRIVLLAVLVLVWPALTFGADGAEVKQLAEVTKKERCPVCGMFVYKYPDWLVQLRHEGGKVVMFDGVKDMFAYYFAPQDFAGSKEKVTDIIVKDYYTQEWIDGFKAYYVTGNENVFGPMGHELIPFSSFEGAENFYKDHRGKKILRFEEVTHELVHVMRGGQAGDLKDSKKMNHEMSHKQQ